MEYNGIAMVFLILPYFPPRKFPTKPQRPSLRSSNIAKINKISRLELASLAPMRGYEFLLVQRKRKETDSMHFADTYRKIGKNAVVPVQVMKYCDSVMHVREQMDELFI